MKSKGKQYIDNTLSENETKVDEEGDEEDGYDVTASFEGNAAPDSILVDTHSKSYQVHEICNFKIYYDSDITLDMMVCMEEDLQQVRQVGIRYMCIVYGESSM